jgi:hypothetical protein
MKREECTMSTELVNELVHLINELSPEKKQAYVSAATKDLKNIKSARVGSGAPSVARSERKASLIKRREAGIKLAKEEIDELEKYYDEIMSEMNSVHKLNVLKTPDGHKKPGSGIVHSSKDVKKKFNTSDWLDKEFDKEDPTDQRPRR